MANAQVRVELIPHATGHYFVVAGYIYMVKTRKQDRNAVIFQLFSLLDTLCIHYQRSRSLKEMLYFPLHIYTLYKTIQLNKFAHLFPIIKGFTLFIVMVSEINSSPKLHTFHTEKTIQFRMFNFAYLFTEKRGGGVTTYHLQCFVSPK